MGVGDLHTTSTIHATLMIREVFSFLDIFINYSNPNEGFPNINDDSHNNHINQTTTFKLYIFRLNPMHFQKHAQNTRPHNNDESLNKKKLLTTAGISFP